MNYYPLKEIGEQVEAREAARLYGAVFDRSGRILCPFHNDKNPSLSFKRGRFRCWSCGANGDSIDYTSRLFGLTKPEAAKKLNADFDLGIMEPATEEERERTRRQRELADEQKRIGLWRTETIGQLNDIMLIANKAMKRGGAFTDKEAAAIRNKDTAENMADFLEACSVEYLSKAHKERGVIAEWLSSALNMRALKPLKNI